MASTIVGRTTCPECGFGSAHVKKSERCLYRFCPECRALYHTSTERQRADLTAKVRQAEAPASDGKAAPAAPAPVADKAPAGASIPQPKPEAPKKGVLFGAF